MVIGVTYCDGEVFQHFGRSPEIALYLVDEDSGVVTKKIATVGENGHEAIAYLLRDFEVEYLLCGGIGQGAVNALTSMGIEVYPGCSGNADELIRKFLTGAIEQVEGPTCGCHGEHGEGHDCHHEGEEHSCHCHDENK